MSQFAEQISKSKGLLDAVQAISNRKAFISLFATLTGCGLLMAAFAAISVSFLGNGHYSMASITGFIGFVCVGLLAMIGTSATGFLLNDMVRGRDSRSIGSAFLVAAATVHRQLGVLALLFIIGLVLLLAIALLLLICKIPGIGPVLYTVIFPVSALALGVTFYAGIFVVALHGPAIWEGNPIMRTIALLGAIVKNRLLSVVIQTILLGLLVSLVGSLVFGAVAFGVGLTGALSVPILGQGLGMDMIMGLTSAFTGMGGGSGYSKAAAFGMALLFGSALVAPVLVAIAGNCVIYANVTENLSTEAVERSIQGALDAAREKAEQAKRQLEESRQQATLAVATATAAACSQCQVAITPEDAFCGNCGNRLK